MENKETITTLKGISEETSKAGRKYYKVQTDEGSMTMFDKPIIEEMMKHVGKRVRLEYAEKDNFKNLKKFLGEVGEEKVIAAKIQKAFDEGKDIIEPGFTEARKLKEQSIYTSYAKDIFLALHKTDSTGEQATYTMDIAIKLVKQAREAFKD